MKICAYVQNAYAKRGYKNECLDTRQFVGLRVIIDALSRNGYSIEWAGIATVHEYDIVLVSLTSDCDWWTYITERLQWRKGNYKVIIGGAGVLHVTPFLPFGDYFSLGRGEESVVNLVRKLDGKEAVDDDSIIESASFSPDKRYMIRQTDKLYPYNIPLVKGKEFKETAIGCNHRCLFCAYTWQRKPILNGAFMYDSGLFDMAVIERAMIDMMKDPDNINFSRLINTAMDGMSERLRYMVNKRISKQLMIDFVKRMIESESTGAKPHRIKLFNIIGLPTETEDDWREYLDTIKQADMEAKPASKQWCIALNVTPFRAMPATPLACAPMSKINYRQKVANVLGKDLKGWLIYSGRSLYSVEGKTESLSSIELAAIAHRGDIEDTETIIKLCRNKAFWRAKSDVKAATLEKYFNMDKLFGEFTAETLPSRYLRTWCAVEKAWERPLWRDEYAIKLPK